MMDSVGKMPAEPVALDTSWNARDLRNTFGRFATGVAVMTTRASEGGGYVGLTANSFSSLSLDPPLVLWSLGCSQGSREAFQNCSHFGINILAEHQVSLSNKFASQIAERFSGVAHSQSAWGVPILHGCAAWLICSRQSCTEIGDHLLFIGKVEALGSAEEPPLLFHRGRYATMHQPAISP